MSRMRHKRRARARAAAQREAEQPAAQAAGTAGADEETAAQTGLPTGEDRTGLAAAGDAGPAKAADESGDEAFDESGDEAVDIAEGHDAVATESEAADAAVDGPEQDAELAEAEQGDEEHAADAAEADATDAEAAEGEGDTGHGRLDGQSAAADVAAEAAKAEDGTQLAGAAETELELDSDADELPSNVASLSASATGRLKSIIESLLFAADKPLSAAQLKEMTRERDELGVVEALHDLVQDYSDRGVVLHEVAGAYQFRTNPGNSAWVSQLIAGRPVRLSRAQLEALAIVAYRQPITRPEIEEVRGVDTGSALRILLERGLIRILGKKEEPGRPLLYGTTRVFLEFFNLNDLRDLPTLREFHELSEDSRREVEKLGFEADDSSAPDEAGHEPVGVEAEPAGHRHWGRTGQDHGEQTDGAPQVPADEPAEVAASGAWADALADGNEPEPPNTQDSEQGPAGGEPDDGSEATA
jgi:segregation and condensation protein B